MEGRALPANRPADNGHLVRPGSLQRLLQRATTTAPTCRAASWPRNGRPTRGRIAWTIRRRRRTTLRACCRRAMACSRPPLRWRRGSTGTSPWRTRRSTWSGTRIAGRQSIISRLVGDPIVPPLVQPRLAHRRSTPPVLSIIMVSKSSPLLWTIFRWKRKFRRKSAFWFQKIPRVPIVYYLHPPVPRPTFNTPGFHGF